jgi:hypothetical protein
MKSLIMPNGNAMTGNIIPLPKRNSNIKTKNNGRSRSSGYQKIPQKSKDEVNEQYHGTNW